MPRTKSGQNVVDGVGPNTARAWLNTFFLEVGPILDIEIAAAARHRLDWRPTPPGFESYMRLDQSLSRVAQENLAQARSLVPELNSLVTRHDDGVRDLVAACQCVEHKLLLNQEFLARFNQVRSMAISEGPGLWDSSFGAYRTPEQQQELLLQHIINDRSELPSQYQVAPVWNTHRQALLAIRNEEAIAPLFERVSDAREELGQAASSLRDYLRELRMSLALKHDLPFAEPVTR